MMTEFGEIIELHPSRLDSFGDVVEVEPKGTEEFQIITAPHGSKDSWGVPEEKIKTDKPFKALTIKNAPYPMGGVDALVEREGMQPIIVNIQEDKISSRKSIEEVL